MEQPSIERACEASSQDAGRVREFFDSFVDKIRISELLFSNGMASKEEGDLFGAMIAGDMEKVQEMSRQSSSLFCAQLALSEFLRKFMEFKTNPPEKLALEMTGSKLLVWAEVAEDDDSACRALLLADAAANARVESLGYSTSITVVESSDGLEAPRHYKLVLPAAA